MDGFGGILPGHWVYCVQVCLGWWNSCKDKRHSVTQVLPPPLAGPGGTEDANREKLSQGIEDRKPRLTWPVAGLGWSCLSLRGERSRAPPEMMRLNWSSLSVYLVLFSTGQASVPTLIKTLTERLFWLKLKTRKTNLESGGAGRPGVMWWLMGDKHQEWGERQAIREVWMNWNASTTETLS